MNGLRGVCMEQKSVLALWDAVDRQDWEKIGDYFCDDATIFWHNTNERFSVSEFIVVNRSYPGDWRIKVERIEQVGNLVISVVKVWLLNGDQSFHAISFFEFEGERIKLLNEYWGDDGEPPQWRINKKIGRKII